MNRKNAYLLLAAAVIILIGIGIYFFMPPKKVDNQINNSNNASSTIQQQSKTDTWLTYKNDKYGYEIKYPFGGNVSLLDNRDDSLNIGLDKYFNISNIRRNKLNSDIAFLSTRVLVESNDKNLSLDNWVYDVELRQQTGAPYPDEIKQITIDGVPAIYMAYNYESQPFGFGEYAPVFIYFTHNNYLYRISGIKIPEQPSSELKNDPYFSYVEQYMPIFDEMVKSFKFTN